MGMLADSMRRMLAEIKEADERLIADAEHLAEQARALQEQIEQWLQDEHAE